MLNLVSKIFKKKSYPLNTVKLSKSNLLKNYHYLTHAQKGIKVAPVLKSNAYGHGMVQVASIIDSLKPPFVCVDSLYEAGQLKKLGVKAPILIMGFIDPKSLMGKKYGFSYAVFDLGVAGVLNTFQKGSFVHIFVDTGMNREGIKVGELERFIEAVKAFKNIKVKGLMTHLADADNPESKLTQVQLKNLEKALKICKKQKLIFKWVHVGGSAALLNTKVLKKLKELGVNVVRSGVALYGISPVEGIKHNLRPVLSLKTKVIQIKKIGKGERCGYGGTFTAKTSMTIGILPIGYNDGVDRRLSSVGSVLVSGVVCPVIGRVSMNLTTIDITDVKNPAVGQEVVVFSDNPTDANSIENASKTCNTIPYDLFVHLVPSTKRMLV